MHSKRAMPLSLRVASIYAMLVAATLLVAAGLAEDRRHHGRGFVAVSITETVLELEFTT